ncbi:flavodoxin [Tersicoccus solisilvae]|uniref:Flavodoxin n=1 Tax=Tersicoccus solisilvae TaxID=1882339 RepID=A0ABQ1P4U1_9MICC|nr:flavodoxin domain-containing protein [Tersicoccus solisilvae]GGC89103.1 flavodoxin [Tersicoccus solisilvae]
MRALVVYESAFGNTHRIAEAIAAGLREQGEVTVTSVENAPRRVSADIDLVVAGGPTHAFSMSRRSTREVAQQRGAPHADPRMGIRDWIADQRDRDRHATFAAFDTRVPTRFTLGTAAASAARAARRRGFPTARPHGFRVEGYEGPLLPGELDDATEWGRRLASEYGDT